MLAAAASLAIGILLATAGCTALSKPAGGTAAATPHAPTARPLEAIEVPRRIGLLENAGLQIPVISPDGEKMLYLRTDQPRPMPMTLFGSPDPQDTPPEGNLSIWIRSVSGTTPGHPLSPQRWAHSPVWSSSSRAVAYVVNEPPRSYIMHIDLASGQQTQLGVPGACHCMPRFDSDDRTLLFCAGPAASGPMRIYRQAPGELLPTPLSPEGADCLCPAMTAAGKVLCVQVEGEHLNWAWCTPDSTQVLLAQWGLSSRLELLQVWAGISTPVSPAGDAVLFYDVALDRICVLHPADKVVRRHRPGSIAACWLDNRTIALATAGGAFVTDAQTGVSTSLFSGQWIPCRYMPAAQRLILLGQQDRRFAIWEVTARSQNQSDKPAQPAPRHIAAPPARGQTR